MCKKITLIGKFALTLAKVSFYPDKCSPIWSSNRCHLSEQVRLFRWLFNSSIQEIIHLNKFVIKLNWNIT